MAGVGLLGASGPGPGSVSRAPPNHARPRANRQTRMPCPTLTLMSPVLVSYSAIFPSPVQAHTVLPMTHRACTSPGSAAELMSSFELHTGQGVRHRVTSVA